MRPILLWRGCSGRLPEVMLVTQNVDNLHERAGSPRVIHMHGELLQARCLACAAEHVRHEDITLESECPDCGTAGRLRSAVVWFNERPLHLPEIAEALRRCSLFIAIGTSGSVYPAAGFVDLVPGHSIELNLAPSAVRLAFRRGDLWAGQRDGARPRGSAAGGLCGGRAGGRCGWRSVSRGAAGLSASRSRRGPAGSARRHLPLGPRPVFRVSTTARLLIVGQAPGTKVHETGIPWNDASGDRLRDWLALDRETFYDVARIAILPVGFCYPGVDRPWRRPAAPAANARRAGRTASSP